MSPHRTSPRILSLAPRSALLGWRCSRGTSAIEFGLLAPVLFFSFLAMVDAGFAVYERMALDQLLRSGAELAMSDGGQDEVRQLLVTTAEREITGYGSGWEEFNPTAVRYCACPSDPETATDCSANCEDSRPIAIYYRLAAQKAYDGLILPTIQFSPIMKIQVR